MLKNPSEKIQGGYEDKLMIEIRVTNPGQVAMALVHGLTIQEEYRFTL